MSNHPSLETTHRSLKRKLANAGVDAAMLEATLILELVTGSDRAEQIAMGNKTLSLDDQGKLKRLLARRLRGEPLDNILGTREFYGLEFVVSSDVLSPRPETELLVDYVLEQTSPDQVCRILDLGTGSGAIPISILKHRSQFMATAVDISKAALTIARQNAAKNEAQSRIEFIEGDWLAPVDGQYDFILSNPPYITDEALAELSPEVKDYDPDLALRGGADGLSAYREIAKTAADYLKLDGKLCLEIGFDQGSYVPEVLRAQGWDNIDVHQDLSGLDRMVVACHS